MSATIAAWIALWGFWILLLVGLSRGELGTRGVAVFIVLWLAGQIGARFVPYPLLLVPYVAVLDIALVFTIFKGDVRIT
jgi:hypothetical protein